MAEKLYVKAGYPKEAIDMYTKANMYEAAHKVRPTIHTLTMDKSCWTEVI